MPKERKIGALLPVARLERVANVAQEDGELHVLGKVDGVLLKVVKLFEELCDCVGICKVELRLRNGHAHFIQGESALAARVQGIERAPHGLNVLEEQDKASNQD